MTHAYSELYLSDAQLCLANAFDYAINDLKFSPELLTSVFVSSPYCRQFETGNPGVISGKSGVEMAADMFAHIRPDVKPPLPTFRENRTSEYWAGWSLAYYQWYTGRRFKDIFSAVPLPEVLRMYHVFHEMDITNFVESIDDRMNDYVRECRLKTIREARGLSQRELAEQSGVKLRMIQLYEQRANDINKARADTLYRLASSLGCGMEDLLENICCP